MREKDAAIEKIQQLIQWGLCGLCQSDNTITTNEGFVTCLDCGETLHNGQEEE